MTPYCDSVRSKEILSGVLKDYPLLEGCVRHVTIMPESNVFAVGVSSSKRSGFTRTGLAFDLIKATVEKCNQGNPFARIDVIPVGYAE